MGVSDATGSDTHGNFFRKIDNVLEILVNEIPLLRIISSILAQQSFALSEVKFRNILSILGFII